VLSLPVPPRPERPPPRGPSRLVSALTIALALTVVGASSHDGPGQRLRPAADSAEAPNPGDHTVDSGKTTPPLPSRTFDLADYGGTCDGQHDNRVPLENAVRAAAVAGGGIVRLPAGTCRVVATTANQYSWLGSHMHLAGAGSDRTSLVLDTDDPTQYRELVHTEGSDITVSDLTLTAGPQVYGVLLKTAPGSDVTVKDVVLDGPGGSGGPLRLQGIMLPSEGRLENLHLDGLTVRGLAYGLLQQSESTATVTRVTVERSTFTGNQADDLSFNAPIGDMTAITVRNNSFTGGNGFSVSLANVHGARIEDNEFRGYAQEFVHIEDRSSDIQITRNAFSGNVLNHQDWYSFVWIGSRSTTVQISDNTFRTSPATYPFQCISVGPGGTNYQAPRNITVHGNHAVLAPNTVLITVYGGAEVIVSP
jgi:hypothetical protein